MNANYSSITIFSLLLIFLVISSVDCVPIPQMEMLTSDKGIVISGERYAISANILTQTTDPAKKPSIDTNLSFAVSPSGKRFNLQAERNEYAFEYAKTNPSPWMLDELSLIDPSQQAGNANPIRWKNGRWKLDLFFTGPTSRPPIHSEFRIYTFWYCPLIMRPF